MSLGFQPRAPRSSTSDPGDQPDLGILQESAGPDPFISSMLEDPHRVEQQGPSQPAIDGSEGDGRTLYSSSAFDQPLLTPEHSSGNLSGDLSCLSSPGLEQLWEFGALSGSIEAADFIEDHPRDGFSHSLVDHSVEREQCSIPSNGNISSITFPPPQLMSPQLTNTPSPAGVYTHSLPMDPRSAPIPSSGPSPELAGVCQTTAHSGFPPYPADDCSSYSENLQAHSCNRGNQAPGPILRVSMHNRGDSPAGSSRIARSSSQRSRTSQSSNLLAPSNYPQSQQADNATEEVENEQLSSPTARHADGSWHENGIDGPKGVSPDKRGKELVMSPNVIVDVRNIEDTNADITTWLQRSVTGSEFGGAEAADENWQEIRQFTNKPRARSVGAQVTRPRPGLADDSGIPGPGATVDEDIEFEYSDDSASPPAEVDLHHDGDGDCLPFNEEVGPEHQDPLPKQFIRAQPWQDPVNGPITTDRNQPATANAAIYQFEVRALKSDASSRIATWGSRRRLSDSDLHSISSSYRGGQQSLKKITHEIGRLIPSRSSTTSKLKCVEAINGATGTEPEQRRPIDILANRQSIQRLNSLVRRSRSPSLSTGAAVMQMSKGLAAVGQGASTATDTGDPSASPLESLKRRRSRSETRSTGDSGAVAISADREDLPRQFSTSPVRYDGQVPDFPTRPVVKMDLNVKTKYSISNPKEFGEKVQQLNPRLQPFLKSRIVHEQSRRYEKLVQLKIKHTYAVKNEGRCPSGDFCFELGGAGKDIGTRTNSRTLTIRDGQSQATTPDNLDEDKPTVDDGSISTALFPTGIPLPPVKRLPAEFECPLCFEVKKFQKPSDWTKHVHEDVQPFTCTFPDCVEARSFKRKADWVRHEDEKHRRLEWWRCQMPDCTHECHRKDNFVQHLVREHKKRDPKGKPTRASGEVAPQAINQQSQIYEQENEELWQLVDQCHFETLKTPKDEVCKFCGNFCSTWKELKVHLAKHMEQIAMPILDLVKRRNVTADTVIDASDSGRRAGQEAYDFTLLPPSDIPGSIHDSPILFRADNPGEDGSVALQHPGMAYPAHIPNLPANINYEPLPTVDQPRSVFPTIFTPTAPGTYPPVSQTLRQSPQANPPQSSQSQPSLMPVGLIYRNPPQSWQMFASPTDTTPSDHLQTNHLPSSMTTYTDGSLTTGLDMASEIIFNCQDPWNQPRG